MAKKNEAPKTTKVSMTMMELIDSGEALEFLSMRPLRSKVSFRIGQLRQTLKPFEDAFTETRNKLVTELGTINKKTKKPQIKEGTANFTKFQDELRTLGDEVIEFESIELKLADLEPPTDEDGENSPPWLTGKVLGDLHWLVKE